MSKTAVDVEIIGEGRDLVLLHSLLSDRSSYEPLAARIAEQRRLILLDLPGFGASPPAGPALADYADAIAAMFDDLALAPETDVLGNGLGGFVALMLASRHGTRFGRMALVGSATAFPEAGRATFRALADKVEQEGIAAVADAAMRRIPICYDASMRTTLTIDDAIAKALKDLAHRSKKLFRQVVNETLHAGLSVPAVRQSRRYKVKPAALGGVSPSINLDKVLALADAIEDQDLARKMQLRK